MTRLALAQALYALAAEQWRREPTTWNEKVRLRALALVAEARCGG